MTTEDLQREAIIKEAMEWIGTKYQHQARIKGVAVDCGQFILQVYENAGLIEHIEVKDYKRDWYLHRESEKYIDAMSSFTRPVDFGKPGDLILFKFGRCVAHGGIILEPGRMIHSNVGIGVVINDYLNDAVMMDRIAGYRRYKEWI